MSIVNIVTSVSTLFQHCANILPTMYKYFINIVNIVNIVNIFNIVNIVNSVNPVVKSVSTVN